MTTLRNAAILVALLTAGAASAQDGAMPKVRQACMADVQKLCPDAATVQGGMGQCFKAHFQDMSPECKSAIMARRAAAKARKSQGTGAMTPAPNAPSNGMTPPN